jgi:pimeloyl-ACP methyl ester carboxylesterase
MRLRILAGSVTAVVMAAGCIAVTPPAPASAAATPTVPLLTGGLLKLTGSESSSFSWNDGQGTGQNTSASMDALTTTYLMPVQYPGVPQLPASNYPDGMPGGSWSEALSWSSPVGTESDELFGTDSNNTPFDWTCSWTVDTQRPQTTAPAFPGQQAWAPPFTNPSLTNPQCSDPSHPVQAAPFLAGGDVARLTVPTQPAQATSIQAAVDQQDPPCVSGAFPNCTGHDEFTGTISLHCLLCVTDISFRQLEDPSSTDDTLTDVPGTGTYDGNRVEIDATVQNVGNAPITTPVYFLDADAQQWLVPDDPAGFNPLQQITFPAGSTEHVTMEWNTTGYAWQNDQPHSVRRVEVMTPLGGAYRDITVLPKPVVLVHGWNSDASTWGEMKNLLRAQNPDWHGYAVGDNSTWSPAMDTDPVSGASIDENAFTLGKYIESLRAHLGAQHVDIVGHSMGGLISRDYIAKLMPGAPQPPGNRPIVSHLLMLGTPNMGSPCAEPMSTLFGQFGSATPTFQLRPDYIRDVFDKTVTDQHGVPFSVMAGYGYGLLCNPAVAGDMVVAVTSAWWTYTDVDKIFDRHTQLPDDPAILTDFIKPRLAVSPPILGAAADLQPNASAATPRGAASRAPSGSTVPDQLVAASSTTIKSRATRSISVSVPKGATQLDALFTAPASVAATLISPSGKKIATQPAGGASASQPMRGLLTSKPVAGTWKITLHNSASAPAKVVLGADVGGSDVTLTEHAARNSAGHLVITATLSQSGRPLRAVTMTAEVRGTPKPLGAIRLYDDGKHHDAAAGDGTYGAATTAVPAGRYLVVVKAGKRATVRFTSVISS